MILDKSMTTILKEVEVQADQLKQVLQILDVISKRLLETEENFQALDERLDRTLERVEELEDEFN